MLCYLPQLDHQPLEIRDLIHSVKLLVVYAGKYCFRCLRLTVNKGHKNPCLYGIYFSVQGDKVEKIEKIINTYIMLSAIEKTKAAKGNRSVC